ncbi:hypothetical protein Smp_135750 [Schistosoma mansoni]|uniref:Secreted protein n=1 Tax=Schistosoma mansoni TaxID=6183 RepID=G4VM93_SCHMA|nr:hypothetical protein Smp_135750 [Schistosoma mansoni]|eukprot:XP_018653197.1 hypothetical protein Smp_135750 [Schistosoma mansoni]
MAITKTIHYDRILLFFFYYTGCKSRACRIAERGLFMSSVGSTTVESFGKYEMDRTSLIFTSGVLHI